MYNTYLIEHEVVNITHTSYLKKYSLLVELF